jgi:hypothetical protein
VHTAAPPRVQPRLKQALGQNPADVLAAPDTTYVTSCRPSPLELPALATKKPAAANGMIPVYMVQDKTCLV